jgi:hypothetical protein
VVAVNSDERIFYLDPNKAPFNLLMDQFGRQATKGDPARVHWTRRWEWANAAKATGVLTENELTAWAVSIYGES